MAIVSVGYSGPNVEIVEIELELAEVSYTYVHGLGGVAVPFLAPLDAGFFSQQVLLANISPGSITVTKTAGAIAKLWLMLVEINARQFG